MDDKEITIWNFVNGNERTFAREELDNPDFNIASIFAQPEMSSTPTSTWEGGYPILKNEDYQQWEWPIINWVHTQLTRQLNFVDERNALEGIKDNKQINIQPTMFRYSIQLDESDLIYNVTHEEVLSEHFNPEWIIDHMLMAWNVPAEHHSDRFQDKWFSNYFMLILGMTHLPGQQNNIKKHGNKKLVLNLEGMSSVE